ncbi:M20/M25/M40 family metallo-hydrolase [Rhodococcus sp. BP-349]|nr:M20/M25/M40 family metallo-hydrolase [Rhodococcus sp. BP-363]MBY6542274.1 M20/M25/M40 family metallo-hydrolase [Rhodococcus sp. BP-369]MBY6561504.1 M20/M25/M40 family metallo-hydrolase [Rhodococcus sp. BP-370]MBY6575796.1 M20/M25/M40 family metallo-hydrolase [Rhodococcus sp. BP-364]MBY6585097.1 M20/M25/M40 family metallo-hydrolase [Rhodococcus sp. BP-358]MBY6589434.1 M20/M25/M40 family metallo-hydrolase [Rhodococcus sp. BP-362]MBY6594033.1 M20/M25/M40 family metallo-hydrolase [Rhodococcus 
MVDIASPTGGEGPLAEWIASDLAAAGVEAEVQRLDASQANAVATIRGGDGPSLLLYAPIDTFTTGDPALDIPGAAVRWRSDLAPRSVVSGDIVEGLGAGNPKGHGAVVLAVLHALHAAGITPPGDVLGGFGAGGMPSFAVSGVGAPDRTNTGHGVGAGFMLERGHATDFAVIAKPGWTVLHEEVGLVWIDVTVQGLHTYVGSRHRIPYSNAVASAGRVAVALEDWLEDYAVRHRHATMTPQGIVSSISGGLERLAASTPAAVTLRLDLRLTTQQTPATVLREVRAMLAGVSDQLGVAVSARQVAAVPATHTRPDSPVIRAAVEAFETVSGAPHEIVVDNSGATDANILRMRGVPTARVGMPKVTATPDGSDIDFTRGMNLVALGDMRRLAEILIRTVFLLPTAGDHRPT